MHELTVAMQICSALERELDDSPDAADATGPLIVDVVRVRVGALSGIVPEALEFAWPHAVAGSRLLGDASIEIEFVDVAVNCTACSTTSTTPDLTRLRCPLCRSPDVQIHGGDELDIVSVDVHDRAGASAER